MSTNTEQEILSTLIRKGALITDGHFVHEPSRHSDSLVDLTRVFAHPEFVSFLAHRLAYPFWDDDVDIVVGVSDFGIALAGPAATDLSMARNGFPNNCLATWISAQSSAGHGSFTDLVKGRRALLVDGTCDDTQLIQASAGIVREYGGNVIGASVICNLGSWIALELGVPKFESLCGLELNQFDESDCPLCRSRIPVVVDVDYGQEFANAHPGYPTRTIYPRLGG